MATRKSSVLNQGLLIGLVVVVAAVAGLAIYYSSFLGARLTGPDVAQVYAPLVRHLVSSQAHCYDDGSQYCEKYMKATKEFTLAYLFQQKPRGLKLNAVYGCFDARKTSTYLITKAKGDCTRQKLKVYQLGYTSQTPDFEAPVMLYRCFEKGSGNYLVTDDRAECELTAHTDEIIELGYAAMGGHLPQRRLNDLCATAERAGVLTDARRIFCYDPTTVVISSPQPSPTPPRATPSPSPVVSWQNPKNRFDVNNDGQMNVQDLLPVVNVLRSRGEHELTVARDGSPPPYVDVNGDGDIKRDDLEALQEGQSSPSVTSWQNPKNRFDVNNNGVLDPSDRLPVLNSIRQHGHHRLTVERDGNPPPYIDVSGEGSLNSFDVAELERALGANVPTQ